VKDLVGDFCRWQIALEPITIRRGIEVGDRPARSTATTASGDRIERHRKAALAFARAFLQLFLEDCDFDGAAQFADLIG
jgi:hypothetical protein